VARIRSSSVGNIPSVASKSTRLDPVKDQVHPSSCSLSCVSAIPSQSTWEGLRCPNLELVERALYERERLPSQWLGTISDNCRPFAQVVKVKLAPVAMVPPRPGCGWGREGFGAGRAGRGAGRRSYAWHRMDRGGGRNNRGQWDHGNPANLG
jgi:hypothetical protein